MLLCNDAVAGEGQWGGGLYFQGTKSEILVPYLILFDFLGYISYFSSTRTEACSMLWYKLNHNTNCNLYEFSLNSISQLHGAMLVCI